MGGGGHSPQCLAWKEGRNLGASDPNSQPAAQPAAALWRSILARIPTVFGRLLFMANLRDRETGRYSHPTFSAALGAEEADRVLRHSHYQVFSQWLVFSLAEQKEDLDEFLGEPAARERLSDYRNLPPARAHEVERQLYLTDLETLLELLIVEQSGVSRSREA
ncbi:MAG: hypothetical protein ABSF25_13090 [Bryobacteraceae bacterium]